MNIYLGENIKNLRKTRGLTQEEFANSIGVSFQTVSKWERGDCYPDITMLPIISEYFETNVDALLGIDKSKREQKANEYIAMYSKLRLKERKFVLEEFEKAVREFPNDYRIVVRYMELLMEEKFSICRNDFENVSKEIETLFRKIQDNCTDDAIRIWAKRLICRYLHYKYDCCGFDENYYNQAMEIIDTMPSLGDSKELLSMEHAVLSNWDPGAETYALRHVNMTLTGGQRLAVVGINGSGKTTFIKLMCRLYDPTEGTILLNGIDIKCYNYNQYMSLFSVVFQDFNLFSFSLGENVAAGGDYDTEKVLSSLRKSGFGDRLNTMPDGIRTSLYKDFDKNGVEISGGEAQKIALARALYKDAPFIILDEPTAALDPIAEYEIYSKFNEIIGDKTAIYISHRLSSCRFCDKILVFDNGQIVQSGSHEELITQEDGKYYELWHAQAQYYIEDENCG